MQHDYLAVLLVVVAHDLQSFVVCISIGKDCDFVGWPRMASTSLIESDLPVFGRRRIGG